MPIGGASGLKAQDLQKEQQKYRVEVDSEFVKATPYEITFENGREIHHDEDVEWYYDAKIYEFTPKKLNENGEVMEMAATELLPTIFLLSGGAFVRLDNNGDLNSDNNILDDNIQLAEKLATAGNKVIWIQYEADVLNSTKIDKLFFEDPNNNYSNFLNGTESKARLEHASLKSFKDFRVKFKNKITNYVANNIDPNNVFISGISAGAFLSIYSVFLDKEEIPSSISYISNSGTSHTIATIGPTHTLRTSGYPMPAIKGIIPMAGGSLYNNIFNSTSLSTNIAINFMHGTCDEAIPQNEGRVSYKLLDAATLTIDDYNNNDPNLYPHAYGSKYLYTLLTANYSKIGLAQVINGGHNVISNSTNGNNPGWDSYITTNLSSDISIRNPVFDNINNFMKSAMGESGYPTWTNHSYSIFPDIPSIYCYADDLTLLSPPLNAEDVACDTKTATLTGTPSWVSITWTVTSKLQIVGSNTGTSITYKGVSNGVATITATIDYGGGQTVSVSKDITVSLPAFPTPTVTPTGYNSLCANESKWIYLTNLPPNYTSITWTSTGGINITYQNNASVTYTGTSSGSLKASIVTPCQAKIFTYNISVSSNAVNGMMAMNNQCGATILTGSFPENLPTNSTTTFTVNYTNIVGITGAEWQFTCGTILSGPTSYWLNSSTYRSEITVKAPNSSYGYCGDVRVRPILSGPGTSCIQWQIQDLQIGACSGGGWSLMAYPNPAYSETTIVMDYDGNELLAKQYPVEIVDIYGKLVFQSEISDGKLSIPTGNLKPGQYSVLVYVSKEGVLNTSLIIKKQYPSTLKIIQS